MQEQTPIKEGMKSFLGLVLPINVFIIRQNIIKSVRRPQVHMKHTRENT
jgi:hypothetical protein